MLFAIGLFANYLMEILKAIADNLFHFSIASRIQRHQLCSRTYRIVSEPCKRRNIFETCATDVERLKIFQSSARRNTVVTSKLKL